MIFVQNNLKLQLICGFFVYDLTDHMQVHHHEEQGVIMKIAILTSQAGTKGSIHDPAHGQFPSADYVAFSDKPLNLKVWEHRFLHAFSTDKSYDARRHAKLVKVLGWMLVPGYDYYIWQDSGCEVQVDPAHLVNTYLLPDKDMALWHHPDRDCAYAEARTVVDYGFEHAAVAHACTSFLQSVSWPPNAGLFEMSSFIYRNSFKMQQAMLTWWELICKYSSRDQIMFPYVRHIHDIQYNYMPGRAQRYAGNNTLIPQVR